MMYNSKPIVIRYKVYSEVYSEQHPRAGLNIQYVLYTKKC